VRRVGGGEDADEVTSGPVEVRLGDVQDEAARGGRIERVAAALQYRLRRSRGQPVRRRGHPEGAGEGRPCREGHAVGARRAIHSSTSSAVRGIAAERFSTPSVVTRTSSSMRTPMPRYSSGTVRSSIWKYRPGSMVKTMPGSRI